MELFGRRLVLRSQHEDWRKVRRKILAAIEEEQRQKTPILIPTAGDVGPSGPDEYMPVEAGCTGTSEGNTESNTVM